MSTRASISVLDELGLVHTIYNHHDGYEAGLGKMLKEHYNTQESAMNLISHGDASSVGPTVDECTFYHRDRNEDWDDVQPGKNQSIADAMETYEQGYDYIFVKGEWKLLAEGGSGAFRSF